METTERLAEVFLMPNGPREMRDLLTDLLTPQEIETIVLRWRNAKLVAEGLTREEVREKTGSSLATISRARRIVDHGTGIIKTLVERLHESHEGA
jgi:TrpR-related protein YerC/YecD